MSNPELEQRCNDLRHDLKIWEKKFAATHNGRKAGRQDIKADATISLKYKEYNKLRDVLSSTAIPQTPSKGASSRNPPHDLDRTPPAPKVLVSTPLKRKREHGGDTLVAASPSQLLSPQGPAFIGPTPQRDGIVLGLFDLLPAGTPSKTRTALHDVVPNILRTPNKNPTKVQNETSFESRGRREKTPLSTGKRFLLDQFVTPKKNGLDDEGTPTSTLKGFNTPAFLRRDNFLTAINEGDEPTPRPAPWKRRGLGRSLSTMIQSIRKQEEDRLDEEADIMRELEMEEEGMPTQKRLKLPEVLVEDSQISMPLGPDRGLESNDEDDARDDEVGPDGKPKRIWKKKGLKRQTRRVIMKPNFTRPKPAQQQLRHEDSDEDEAAATETQPNDSKSTSNREFSDDEAASDYASDASHNPKKRKAQQKKIGKATVQQSKDSNQSKDGSVTTAARKIKATAHANYRRLKIKSKGGNGGKGRFGRRR